MSAIWERSPHPKVMIYLYPKRRKAVVAAAGNRERASAKAEHPAEHLRQDRRPAPQGSPAGPCPATTRQEFLGGLEPRGAVRAAAGIVGFPHSSSMPS